MLQTKMNMISNGFEKRYTVTVIDESVIKQTKDVFNKYKSGRVILNDNFEDTVWTLTNQITTVSFNFDYDNINFHKNTKQWIGCSYSSYMKTTKAYAVLRLGDYSLLAIQEIIRDFHALLKLSYKEVLEQKASVSDYALELLRLLPDSVQTRDLIIELIDEVSTQKRMHKKQRLLAEFRTYFAFHDTFHEFWNNADSDLKLQFFPLRLWWTLTSILPLRPTEFLLIPRQCVECKENKWILTIRRTMLKGGYRKKAYRIDEDYELKKYVITQDMAKEILEYIDLTKDMCQSKINTLFVQKPHNVLVGQNIMNKNRYYSYANLSTCLKKFQEQYMKIHKDKNCLINLGDTRHIAMINLIISGGSPTICKELAGHSNINISSHYYSNISNFIECATYEAYKKSISNSATLQKHRSQTRKANAVKLDDGYCDSDKYRSGSIEDCIKYLGSDGRIGFCPECPHFIDGKHGMYVVFDSLSQRKKRVDEDSKHLIEAIDKVRRGIGYNEDIQSALLRLQHSSTWYSKCLQTDLEVNEDGETT